MSTKRLRQRAHQQARKDAEYLTLAPLTFEQAVKGDSGDQTARERCHRRRCQGGGCR
jgi:DnaJ-class molecular chaperone